MCVCALRALSGFPASSFSQILLPLRFRCQHKKNPLRTRLLCFLLTFALLAAISFQQYSFLFNMLKALTRALVFTRNWHSVCHAPESQHKKKERFCGLFNPTNRVAAWPLDLDDRDLLKIVVRTKEKLVLTDEMLSNFDCYSSQTCERWCNFNRKPLFQATFFYIIEKRRFLLFFVRIFLPIKSDHCIHSRIYLTVIDSFIRHQKKTEFIWQKYFHWSIGLPRATHETTTKFISSHRRDRSRLRLHKILCAHWWQNNWGFFPLICSISIRSSSPWRQRCSI